MVALGGVVVLTGLVASKSRKNEGIDKTPENCEESPKETKGPFPNKTPSDYVRENIIGDRKGIALLMTLTLLNKNQGCEPFTNAVVDVWHCDSQGNYSEYGGGTISNKHFLRGRQITDLNGQVSFISIFPGYYRGRAPHIHVEVLNEVNKSVLVTQIAFPENICNRVYATDDYQGTDYISNLRDGIFRGSLKQNMADSVAGNLKDGYILLKSIVVDT